MINVVGLGSTNYKDLTLEAVEIMNNGNKNFLRTNRHECVNYLEENNIKYKSFDYLYDELNSFDDVYENIVEILINESEDKDINYFVPGTPLVAEKTVKLLISKNIDINIVNGISFIEPVLAAVGRDAVDGLLFLDSDKKRFDFDTSKDILITQVYNERIASDLSLELQEVYKENHKAFIIKDAGLKSQVVIETEIYKLARYNEYNHQSCIYVSKSNDIDFNKILRELDVLTEDKYLDEEKLKFLKDSIIENSKDICLDSEDELLEIILNSFIILLIKDKEGYISFKEILDEIYKKLDKIAIFLK